MQEPFNRSKAGKYKIHLGIIAVIITLFLIVICYYIQDDEVKYVGKNKIVICDGRKTVISPDGTKILYKDSVVINPNPPG